MKQGSNDERKLANRLRDEGWAAFRVAGSGSAQRAACDIVAINSSAILLIECKTFKDGDKAIRLDNDLGQLELLDRLIDPFYKDSCLDGRDVVPIVTFKQDGSSMRRYLHYDEIEGSVVPNSVENKLFKLLIEYNDEP